MAKRGVINKSPSLLVGAATIITAIRYAAAFYMSDAGTLTGLISQIFSNSLGIAGLAMGVLDIFGTSYLFDGWRKAMPRNGIKWPFRFWVLTFFVFSLVISGPCILIPLTLARVAGVSMTSVLGGVTSPMLIIWAMFVNVAPYLIIGGVFVGQRMFEEVSVEAPQANISYQRRPSGQRSSRSGNRSQEIHATLERVWASEQRVPGPTEVANILGLDPTRAKGYISDTTKYWKEENRIQ
jgi:hypothetical protein